MIIVLDFGGQYAHLIARRVRELGAYSEILSHDTLVSKIVDLKPKGIILSGGPAGVYEKNSPKIDKKILDLGIPILGICYGHHLLAKAVGSKVTKGDSSEYGRVSLHVLERSGLFAGLKNKELAWFSHGDTVSRLPNPFKITARTKDCKIAAFRNRRGDMLGIQFHPEVVHTPSGNKILSNFIFKICREVRGWKIKNVGQALIKDIRQQLGDDLVLIGVSGGVDSLVAATILNKAVKNNLY